ncbi:DUF4267 domain-containing protein [Luteimicrobium sp. NPDC057192]|uniref:DUF4267 domain-containing protein n=1 Tax=Luteimicrobium sp. NPDC057192 TaxID=3346042 RepID=UPI0036367003
MSRKRLATTLTVLLAVGIGYVGVSYLFFPAATAPQFGMAVWPEGDAAQFLATKGARDLASGLVPLALLLTGQRRALGWVLTLWTVVPLADAVLILSTGGSVATALGVHGLTAAALLVTGVLLLTEKPAPTVEPPLARSPVVSGRR